MSLGASWYAKPVIGSWPFRDVDGRVLYPAEISVEGRIFRKAVIRESKPGVTEQYRQAVPEHSQHLLVRSDGSWVIDHSDDVNPDMGGPTAPIRHFFADHPAAPIAILGAFALLVGFVSSRNG